MPTSYDLIFQKYMHEIRDFDLTSLDEYQMVEENKITLSKAIALFEDCKTILSRNDETMLFNNELSEKEQWIIADYMRKVWIDGIINSGDLLKVNLSDKDFKLFSSADKLRELTKLKKQYEKELKLRVNQYLYKGYNYSNFYR